MTNPRQEPPAFEMRTVTNEDVAAVLELLRSTLGERATTRKTTDYWCWKHVESAFGPSYAVCAEDRTTGHLAALRALMRWRFADPMGTVHSAVRAVDTATHPGYQRRGLFTTLTRHALRELRETGVPFIFNTPNANSLPGYLKMGWRVVERWPVYIRPVRPLRTLWRALSGNRGPSLGPEASGLVEWGAFSREQAAQAADVLRGHERGRRRVGYRTERSLAYLDWRYGAHPNVRYGVYPLLDSAGLLEGFLVARPTTGVRGLTAMALTELFAREPSPAAVRRLLRSALRDVRCDYWSAHFARRTVEHQALTSTLFLKAPGRGYTWTALSLNAAGEDPTQPQAWDLTLGDMEIF